MEDKGGLTLACLNIKKLVKMMVGLSANIKKTNLKNDICFHYESIN
ncbi:Uncharacterised protein [Streptococcus vestibularis]|uniref:Uncharacterized protein n=1 Tax=Streptococcus vestibularis TaxID=1343 RepID=A0A564SR14_STRVE|nr:Uncharacterised protein [Streptococcus vestibularis]